MTSIQEALSAAGFAPTTLSMVEVSNQLVKVVEGLLAFTHDDADYCPSCGQNYYSTVGKTCCDDCGSSCNLQGGCGSEDCTHAPEGCEVGDHEYSDFACPKCGHSCCWGCSTRCTDDSTGEGVFTCPSCGFGNHYPEVTQEYMAGDHCSQKTGCPHLGKPELGCCTPNITEELIEWAKDRIGRPAAWNCSFYTGNDPV